MKRAKSMKCKDANKCEKNACKHQGIHRENSFCRKICFTYPEAFCLDIKTKLTKYEMIKKV